ncbi:MAG: zinc ribbon domain-containing protein [Candidatus Thorarchaeota archaeon]
MTQSFINNNNTNNTNSKNRVRVERKKLNQYINANESHMNGKLFFALVLGIQSLIILIWLILGVRTPLIVVFACIFLGSILCLSIFTTKKQRPRQSSPEWASGGHSSALGSSNYCSNCGMENARDSKYCIACGFQLGQ